MKTNLELARECGATLHLSLDDAANARFTAAQLDAFVERIRADEREQCALVAEAGFRFAKDGYQIADDIRERIKNAA